MSILERIEDAGIDYYRHNYNKPTKIFIGYEDEKELRTLLFSTVQCNSSRTISIKGLPAFILRDIPHHITVC